jgi:hypothetical protein
MIVVWSPKSLAIQLSSLEQQDVQLPIREVKCQFIRLHFLTYAVQMREMKCQTASKASPCSVPNDIHLYLPLTKQIQIHTTNTCHIVRTSMKIHKLWISTCYNIYEKEEKYKEFDWNGFKSCYSD